MAAISKARERTPGSGLRAERTARTRESIIAAARELFATRGYRSTSLREIAASAGISHPGLLRHFAGKADLLAHVVESLEADNLAALLIVSESAEPGALVFEEVAARNETVPGYLPLFATLIGEASSTQHPAHERMRARYATMLPWSIDAFEAAQAHGVVEEERDAAGEAFRLTAAWDGLQVIEQYLPDSVSVVTTLGDHATLLAYAPGWSDATDEQPETGAHELPQLPSFGGEEQVPSAGYRSGHARREDIVAGAMRLFAAEGYGDTSIQNIAEHIGISKSTLLHHYPSKEDLLRAVVRARDAGIASHPSYSAQATAADQLRSLAEEAATNTRESPGLIEVYAVLSCEAVPGDHPAHEYFVDRFDKTIQYFSALFRAAQQDGDLPSHRDPEHEARWLVALWDGLQYQWLYDRTVDVAAHLDAHLADVLPSAR
ncbi:TetR/AcrR family transcriptional regulator [Microbacterium sp. C7(2022)]|uniref:TetR/AcrR family transcriptional regulator n=1 Tax=Microbacterium sp. C7(2022) TaxID=2992759 RepID=UPI00237BAF1E|nr:TetR/AcrR family transcriptional regulator [Microbacterium sp. C7(2022)]MDE0545131.1 TetR/AcrR family transcriptional regulator [Microbacterium sp. C7(2022)]